METMIAEKKTTPRVGMREQPPLVRAKNFLEVPNGYTQDEAVEEASRCLSCKSGPCRQGCPVEVDIPAFIALIKERKFLEACYKVKERNALPAVCGRVCPQEIQCESRCLMGKKGASVAIGNLERFVADYESNNGGMMIPERPKPTGIKVAVIVQAPEV